MVDFLVLLALALLTFVVFFWIYHAHHLGYWARRGVPGPPSRLFWGNYHQIMGDTLSVFQFERWSQTYPSYFGIQKGHACNLVVSDPELAHDVLVRQFECFHGREEFPLSTSPDDYPEDANVFNCRGLAWKRLRMASNPSFTIANIKRVLPTIEKSVDEMLAHLDTVCKEPVELFGILQELTIDIISRIALGQKESTFFHNKYLEFARFMFNFPNDNVLQTLVARFPFLGRPIIGVLKRFAVGPMAIQKAFYETIADEIRARKALKQSGNTKTETADFIDLFLEAEMQGEAEYAHADGAIDRGHMKVDRTLTVTEMVGQCFTFLLAGYDTTANSLSFLVYELLKHPEVLERVQEEIDSECPVDAPLTYDALQRLTFLEAVSKENLRLHPVAASVVSRLCMQNTTIGRDGIRIEKGTNVAVDVHTIHKSRELWGEDAAEFRPERWLAHAHPHPAAFLAFGAGPRVCLGMRLAMLEKKLILVKLLQRFSISKCDRSETELIVRGIHVNHPASVTVKLTPRYSKT